jgi:hypothetical protein
MARMDNSNLPTPARRRIRVVCRAACNRGTVSFRRHGTDPQSKRQDGMRQLTRAWDGFQQRHGGDYGSERPYQISLNVNDTEVAMVKAITFTLLGACAAFGFNAFAQFRPELQAPASAIASSSSNGVSYAWFYDASSRSVYVCRTGQSSGEAVDCKAKTALP